jgi:hypothetical protein
MQAMGIPALDERHRSFDRNLAWSQKKVDMVAHHDECMEFVLALGSVVLKRC